jgi:hypothetical protein
MSRVCQKIATTLIFSGLSLMAVAQDTASAPSSGTPEGWMTSHGKIGVVMVVCLTILIGLLGYLVRLDLKISRLEKSDR